MDPLAGLQVDVKSFDVGRIASVYFDSEGNRCWTKAWFNGREKGEPAIEINRQLAIAFISDQISKDSWLARFWPKQHSNCIPRYSPVSALCYILPLPI